MAIVATVDPALRIGIMRYDGNASVEEWQSALDAILADPSYQPGFGILVDRRKATSAQTADFIRQTAAHIEKNLPRLTGSRWAAVVTEPAQYGMIRMGQVLADSWPITVEIFDDVEVARAWLTGAVR